jgi:hypothetical protein
MAHINSTANPIFYILLNPAFKKSFKSLKKRMFGIDLSVSAPHDHNSSIKHGHSMALKRRDRSNSLDTGSTIGKTKETFATVNLKPNNKVSAVE